MTLDELHGALIFVLVLLIAVLGMPVRKDDDE